jgi:lipopolysaccharide transport system ATP-binding protein
MNPSIEIDHVSKRYRIGQAPLSLRSLLKRRKTEPDEQYHWAVNDLNVALYPGDALGVIGPNGAGKTTILKLLSKVTFPSSGQIRLHGRFSSLIELGAGFHPELTGRENVYLNGTILGMRKAEIAARFDEIVEFAGIGKFLDTPVKRYSSGMYARLGFAVAAHVDPEILLVDEVLAVGDMAFQKKCYERMLQMISKGTTLIFVSHNMRAVQKVCNRCLVMYRGHPVFDGEVAEATAEYSNILRKAAADYRPVGEVESGISQRIMTQAAVIENVRMLRMDGTPAASFQSGETVRVQADVRFQEDAPAPIFACSVRLQDMQVAYDYTTHWADLTTPAFTAGSRVTVEFILKLGLVTGTYHLGINLAYHDLTRYYDRLDRALDFVVTAGGGAKGVADLQGGFRVLSVEQDQELEAPLS